MRFEIELNGRTRSVSIEPGAATGAGGSFRVRIDGVLHEVDARPTDLGLSLVFRESGRTVDVAIVEGAGGEMLLQLPRVNLVADVDGRRFRRKSAGRTASDGELRITAPMPGRVLRVLVSPGDDVAARQGLVVVEAMKMENEIRSPRAGRVRDVAVADGQSVEGGRLLVVIE